MAKHDEELVILWDESKAIAQADKTHQYVVFAKRLRDRTLNEACSLVCFYCRDEIPIYKAGPGGWQHLFFGENKKVRDRTECKAAAIREIVSSPTTDF